MAVSVSFADQPAGGNVYAAATTTTFTAAAIGAAAADKLVFVFTSVKSTDADPGTTVSAVTIDGISAAEVTGITAYANGSARRNRVQLWWALVTTGPTGDIVLTFNSSNGTAQIAVFAVTGADTTTPVSDKQGNSATSGTSLSFSAITIPTNGAGIGAGVSTAARGASNTFTWTNLTERSDDSAVSSADTSSSGSTSASFASSGTQDAAAGIVVALQAAATGGGRLTRGGALVNGGALIHGKLAA